MNKNFLQSKVVYLHQKKAVVHIELRQQELLVGNQQNVDLTHG